MSPNLFLPSAQLHQDFSPHLAIVTESSFDSRVFFGETHFDSLNSQDRFPVSFTFANFRADPHRNPLPSNLGHRSTGLPPISISVPYEFPTEFNSLLHEGNWLLLGGGSLSLLRFFQISPPSFFCFPQTIPVATFLTTVPHASFGMDCFFFFFFSHQYFVFRVGSSSIQFRCSHRSWVFP